MRPAEEQADNRSADAIHEQRAQLEQQAETVLFSHGSLYAVIAMLTLAVLFCAGVLAYSIRRNDLLKAEYRRVMEAFALRASKTTRFPTEPEPTETSETMGPAPKLDESTQDAILLLLTRKPISNIQHPNLNKRPTTKLAATPGGDTVYYDDLASGIKRMPKGTRSGRSTQQKTTATRNETATSSSSGERALVETTPTPVMTLGTTPKAARGTELPKLETSSPATFTTTARARIASEVTHVSGLNYTDLDRNSTQSDADYGTDDDSDDDDA
nr:uncharacterized protein LOC129382463 [Dermacentor andersoni]